MKPVYASISYPFIMRPVATTLLTVAIALAGVVAFGLLPVSPLPQVDFPTISVTAAFPGASPETMAATVATPLERALGRIAGITEMTSSSTLGTTTINLQFDLSRDIDGAARDVQSAINAAQASLPALPNNPTYKKINPADAPIMVLSVTSETMTRAQMYDAVSNVLAQKLSQVLGVGRVLISGSALPAVRVELIPDALNRAGLSLEQVRAALIAANVNTPKGVFENADTQWLIGANDQLLTAEEYEPLIVAVRDGLVIRLSDLGTVGYDAQDLRNLALADGKRAALLILFRQPGANIIETVDRVTDMIPQLRAWMPESADLKIIMDSSPTIRSSLREVEDALMLSMALVVLVVFLFLRNGRATLIPAVAVPVSLVGTFAVMYLCGYSIDNLSLMALTIATGFVVDDAIVVLENIVRHIEAGLKPLQAALLGAREVGFTVVSISLSLVAVFIPILFMGGIAGRLFREFAVVLSTAVLMSLLVSLTTTPMMCAYVLRGQGEEPRATRPRRFLRERYAGIPGILGAPFRHIGRLWGKALEGMQHFYANSLTVVLRFQKITLLVLGLTICLNIYLYIVAPKGFFPQQDTGRIIGAVRADQSISFQAMEKRLEFFIDRLRKDPAVADAAGFTGVTNTATIFLSLKPRARRAENADQIINRLRGQFSAPPDAQPGAHLFMQAIQDIRVGARLSSSQYQYTLQADDWETLRRYGGIMQREFQQLPELRDIDTDFEERGLRTNLIIDRDAMSRLNVNMLQVDQALYNAFGQRQIATIYETINQYRIVMEYAYPWWQGPDGLERVHVPSATGELAPLSTFARFERTLTSLAVAHQGQFAAITLSFNLAPGVSLSQATAAIVRTRLKVGLPDAVHASFQGTAGAYADTLRNEPILILAALVTLYIVLGILYENLIHPLTILSTLPSAGIGAILALMLFKQEFSVITLIGVLLLAGIVKKNAIMMVDFAIEAARTEGLSPHDAIYRACVLRFRPIMMTTLAAILGAVPLAVGQGDGAELRRPLGIAIVGGLMMSQVLTLYTTPVVYLYLERARLRLVELRRGLRDRNNDRDNSRNGGRQGGIGRQTSPAAQPIQPENVPGSV